MFSKYKLSKFLTDNRGLLLQLAYSWCHDKSLAEDLVQDATEKALKNISRMKHSDAVKAWFITIMLNCWRDMLRKKQEFQNIDDLILNDSIVQEDSRKLSESLTPEKEISREQTQVAVKEAVSRLPIKYRTVLTLVDIYGASYSEVAQIIDVPIGTVMSRINRARQALRKYLLAESNTNTVIPLRNKAVLRGEQ